MDLNSFLWMIIVRSSFFGLLKAVVSKIVLVTFNEITGTTKVYFPYLCQAMAILTVFMHIMVVLCMLNCVGFAEFCLHHSCAKYLSSVTFPELHAYRSCAKYLTYEVFAELHVYRSCAKYLS